MVRWTVDLCADFASPALERLRTLKCYGPIGGECAYFKLMEHQSPPGSYIIRQCEQTFDVYYIDIICKGWVGCFGLSRRILLTDFSFCVEFCPKRIRLCMLIICGTCTCRRMSWISAHYKIWPRALKLSQHKNSGWHRHQMVCECLLIGDVSHIHRIFLFIY